MQITREQFLQASDLKTETVEVPELGGEVIVSELSGADRNEWSELINPNDSENPEDLDAMYSTAALIAYSVVNENGERMFTNEDIPTLCKKSFAVLTKVGAVALRVNGIGNEALEKFEKNSEAAPGGDSV